jgi:hypothetical protein
MYAFITGLVTVLLTLYALTFCEMYCYYRKCGLTRKQAIKATWRMQNE